jgi:hypothetical protein
VRVEGDENGFRDKEGSFSPKADISKSLSLSLSLSALSTGLDARTLFIDYMWMFRIVRYCYSSTVTTVSRIFVTFEMLLLEGVKPPDLSGFLLVRDWSSFFNRSSRSKAGSRKHRTCIGMWESVCALNHQVFCITLAS